MKELFQILLLLTFSISAQAGWKDWFKPKTGMEFFFAPGETLEKSKSREEFKNCKLADELKALNMQTYICKDVKPYIQEIYLNYIDDRLAILSAYFKRGEDALLVLDGLKDKFGKLNNEGAYQPKQAEDYRILSDGLGSARFYYWKDDVTASSVLGIPVLCPESMTYCRVSSRKLLITHAELMNLVNTRQAQVKSGENSEARSKLGF